MPDNYRDFIADLPTDQLLKNWWEYTDYEWRHYKTTTQSQREVRVQREAEEEKWKEFTVKLGTPLLNQDWVSALTIKKIEKLLASFGAL